jgi:hypothetical protein
MSPIYVVAVVVALLTGYAAGVQREALRNLAAGIAELLGSPCGGWAVAGVLGTYIIVHDPRLGFNTLGRREVAREDQQPQTNERHELRLPPKPTGPFVSEAQALRCIREWEEKCRVAKALHREVVAVPPPLSVANVPDDWRCDDCGQGTTRESRSELREHYNNGRVYCWRCLEKQYEWENEVNAQYYRDVDPDVRLARGDSPRELW